MRRTKLLPNFWLNDWFVEKLPNTFAETFVWQCTAVSNSGYQTAKHGFQSKREAVRFAQTNIAPKTKKEQL